MTAIHLLWIIPATFLFGALAGYVLAIFSVGEALYQKLKEYDEHESWR